jgi:hypothetical protein
MIVVVVWTGTFEDNILFVKVSQTPNMMLIVQNLFSYKGIQPDFQIQTEEDAINQLPQLLYQIGSNPILLILDDVWIGSESLPEKFKFDIPNYKILVTSRTAFPRFEFTYNLKPLNEVDAMELFCNSASLQGGSSNIPEEDIKKVLCQSVIYMHEICLNFYFCLLVRYVYDQRYAFFFLF